MARENGYIMKKLTQKQAQSIAYNFFKLCYRMGGNTGKFAIKKDDIKVVAYSTSKTGYLNKITYTVLDQTEKTIEIGYDFDKQKLALYY